MSEPRHDELTEVEALVAEGLELDDIERRSWLAGLADRSRPQAEEVRERLELLGALGWSEIRESTTKEELGRFRLVERIGLGGMGEVWRAEDGSGMPVAIKLVRPELLWFEGARRRFEREVQTVSALDHPDIVRVVEVGEDEGLPWMALEWVEGASLETLLELLRHRPPESLSSSELVEPLAGRAAAFPGSTHVEVVTRMLARTALALEHAHQSGVLHRDVKPSNILLDGSGRVLLADFGLAVSNEAARFTRTGSWLGSLPYAPPEQIDGSRELDARADVYSLGATLYECLTLRTPFLGGGEGLVRARIRAADLEQPRRLNPDVSRSLQLVCSKAMDPDPARRYASARELADDLLAVADGRPVGARTPASWIRASRWARRRPRVAAGLVLTVLTLLAVSTWAVRERSLSVRIQRMADAASVERLQREAALLGPAHPDGVRPIDDWRRRVDAVLSRRAGHVEELNRLRLSALPHGAQQASAEHAGTRARLLDLRLEVEGLGHFLEQTIAADDRPAPLPSDFVAVATASWRSTLADDPERFLDGFLARIAELDRFVVDSELLGAGERAQLADFDRTVRTLGRQLRERRFWRFAEEFDQWRHDDLSQLVSALDDLRESVADVERLRERCIESARVRDETVAEWARVLEAVGSSPLFEGVELAPIPMLRPLGPDPRSGLEEFLLVGTGEAPRRATEEPRDYVVGSETGVVLVLLPGGVFEMGPPASSVWAATTGVQPRHAVRLAPFLISKYELTAAQARRMDELPEEISYQAQDGALPLRLDWTQSSELLAQYGLEHPTEAQWEFAARAGGDAVENGPAYANAADPGDVARLHVVGSLAPNRFGLHDCLGNVAEWCRDWMIVRAYSTLPARPGDGLRTTTLLGPGRIVRGGAFAHPRDAVDPYRRTLGNAVAAPSTGVRPVMHL